MRLPLVETLISQRKTSERLGEDLKWKQFYVIPSCQSSDSCSSACDALSWKSGNYDECVQLQFLSPKAIKKNLIHPSSVDYLYSMSLLYCCIVIYIFSQGKRKSIKVKLPYLYIFSQLSEYFLSLSFCSQLQV